MTDFNLLTGDVIDKLTPFKDASFDAVLCDPPYGLSKQPDMAEVLKHWLAGDDYQHRHTGFMGKSWDSFVPGPSTWKEILRVLKPGGFALVFGGTRTFDLTVTALRLAGFEIRDTIMWVYGSGFPKSCDISKQLDKAAGAESQRKIIGPSPNRRATHAPAGAIVNKQTSPDSVNYNITAPATDDAKRFEGYGTGLKPSYEPIIVAMKPIEGTYAQNALMHGVAGLNIDGSRIAINGENLGRGIYQTQSWKNTSKAGVGSVNENWKKGRWPANFLVSHHPNCKPQGTKKIGKGEAKSTSTPRSNYGFKLSESSADRSDSIVNYGEEEVEVWDCHEDCPVKTMDGQSGDTSSARAGGNPNNPKRGSDKSDPLWGMVDGRETHDYRDKGGASRFFYKAKTAKSERNTGCEKFNWILVNHQFHFVLPALLKQAQAWEQLSKQNRVLHGNPHPTIKPLDLCRYLANLILPPAREDEPRRLLVPFSGSGSEVLGGALVGWEDITSIELDPSHNLIAAARIKHHHPTAKLTTEKHPPVPLWKPTL